MHHAGTEIYYINILKLAVAILSQDWACNPDGFLLVVMVCCPVGMNIVQLWIQDAFLKAKEAIRLTMPLGSSSPRASIGGDALATRQQSGMVMMNMANFGGDASSNDLNATLLMRGDSLQSGAGGAIAAIPEGGSTGRLSEDYRGGPSYRQKQRIVLNLCCGGLATVLFIVILAFFTHNIERGQDFYDPCYVQIKADTPNRTQNVWAKKACGMKGAIFGKVADDQCDPGAPGIPTSSTPHGFGTGFGTWRSDYLEDGKPYSMPHNFSRIHHDCLQANTNLTDDGKPYNLTLEFLVGNFHELRCQSSDIGNESKGSYCWQKLHENDGKKKKTAQHPAGWPIDLPKCMCCNAKTPFDLDVPCVSDSENAQHHGFRCPGLGQCCDRSTVSDPHRALRTSCSLCNVYNPCATHSCAARPQNIRNAQHYPMTLALLIALCTNGYIIYSYLSNSKLRQLAITALLAWASCAELLFCIGALLQELLFRIPSPPCISVGDTNGDGSLDMADCDSSWYGWPTYADVTRTREYVYDSYHKDFWPNSAFRAGDHAGQRGQAVRGCHVMSTVFQFSWTASNSFIFMISVDLMLNLYTSPFGSTKPRWYFYTIWTLAWSTVLSSDVALGDNWGVNNQSILEDFCWNINFGMQGTNSESKPSFEINTISYWLIAVFYPTLSASFAVLGWIKLRGNSLTKSQKAAREPAIREGTVVVGCISVWLLMYFALYYYVILRSEGIMKSIDMDNFKMDYDNKSDRRLVQLWSFVLGGHSIILYVIWMAIVLPRSKKEAASMDSNKQELSDVLQQEILFFTGLGVRAATREAFNVVGAGIIQTADWRLQTGAAGVPVSVSSTGGFSTDSSPENQHDTEERQVEMVAAANYEANEATDFYKVFEQAFKASGTAKSDVGAAAHVWGRVSGNDGDKALKQQLEKCTFKTYRPQRFRYLRELFKVDQKDKSGSNSALHAAMAEYRAGTFSGGASGAFMYKSGDSRFIVKQVTGTEHHTMLKILDEYITHIENSVDGDGVVQSMLLRVVQMNRVQLYAQSKKGGGSCHSINPGRCLQGRLYFIVFENVFWHQLEAEKQELKAAASATADQAAEQPEPEPELRSSRTSFSSTASTSSIQAQAERRLKQSMTQYDLKGSWVNRQTVKRPGDDHHGETLKDGDLHEQLYLPSRRREHLLKQLGK